MALLDKLHTTGQSVLQALEQPEFYIELLLISVALAVSYLLALLIRSFLQRQHSSTLFSLPPEVLIRPVVLLPPLSTVIILSSMRPMAEQFIPVLNVIPAAIELAAAWLIARTVLLLVRTKPIAWFICAVIVAYAALSVTGFMSSTEEYLGGMGFEIGKYRLTMLGVIKGLVIFVIVFWMAGASSRALGLYLARIQALSYSSRELINKFFAVFVYFIAFVITMGALGVDLTALAVFGGALGVGIGLGLQKVTSNFVSGVTVLLEKSIKLGDLIEVGTNTGWVRQMHMRYALIETFDGREVLVPNEELVTQRVTNWTYSNEFARIDIRIMVAYESDGTLARALMLQAAKDHPLCLRQPEPNCWLREFADNGMVFLLTFWIPDVKEGRNTPQSEVMFSIMAKFKAAGIEMPYPRQVQLQPAH